jgi:hypothetical protein
MTGAEALELVLVTTGAVTTAGATSSLLQSWLDRQALIRAGHNGIRHLVVTTRMIRDGSRLASALIISGAGFWCLMLPDDMDMAALVLKHALMFTSWILLASIFSDWHSRRHIEDMLDRVDRGERM